MNPAGQRRRPHFTGPLCVQSVSRRFWRVLEPLAWLGEIEAEVPRNFHTDFASIPAIGALFGFFRDDFVEASTLHDWLYHTRIYPRPVADRQFRAALRATGCGLVHRWVMWAAVRLCGWLFWHGRCHADRRRRRLIQDVNQTLKQQTS